MVHCSCDDRVTKVKEAEILKRLGVNAVFPKFAPSDARFCCFKSYMETTFLNLLDVSQHTSFPYLKLNIVFKLLISCMDERYNQGNVDGDFLLLMETRFSCINQFLYFYHKTFDELFISYELMRMVTVYCQLEQQYLLKTFNHCDADGEQRIIVTVGNLMQYTRTDKYSIADDGLADFALLVILLKINDADPHKIFDGLIRKFYKKHNFWGELNITEDFNNLPHTTTLLRLPKFKIMTTFYEYLYPGDHHFTDDAVQSFESYKMLNKSTETIEIVDDEDEDVIMMDE